MIRRAFWRTDGTRVEEVTHFAKASANGSAAETVRAMAAGPGALWAVTATSSAGTLMRSATGLDWQGVQPFEEAAPVDVLVYAGAPYVGTIGPRGRGGLWGPPAPAGVEPAPEVASVPFSPSASIDVDAGPGVDLAKLDDALRRAVGFQDLRERVIPQFERLIAAAPSGPRPRIGAWLTEQLLMERSSQEVETYAHVVALSESAKVVSASHHGPARRRPGAAGVARTPLGPRAESRRKVLSPPAGRALVGGAHRTERPGYDRPDHRGSGYAGRAALARWRPHRGAHRADRRALRLPYRGLASLVGRPSKRRHGEDSRRNPRDGLGAR